MTEVELDGKRVMPNALRPNERYACDTHDLDAIDSFREFFDDAELIAPMRIYPRRQFLRVLRGLRGHPRVTFGKGTKVEIAAESYRPRLLVRREGESLKLERIPELLAAASEAWIKRGNSFHRLADALPNELFELADHSMTLRGDLLALLAPQLREWFEIEGDSLPDVQTAEPKFLLKIEGSFVRGMMKNESDHKIVVHIHELAQSFIHHAVPPQAGSSSKSIFTISSLAGW